MNPADIKTIVDTAAGQSDRWLFIALIVIGLFAIWMFAKYFISELKVRDVKHDELNKFVRDEHSELVAKCTIALAANTRVIERLTDQRDEVTERTYDSQRPHRPTA